MTWGNARSSDHRRQPIRRCPPKLCQGQKCPGGLCAARARRRSDVLRTTTPSRDLCIVADRKFETEPDSSPWRRSPGRPTAAVGVLCGRSVLATCCRWPRAAIWRVNLYRTSLRRNLAVDRAQRNRIGPPPLRGEHCNVVGDKRRDAALRRLSPSRTTSDQHLTHACSSFPHYRGAIPLGSAHPPEHLARPICPLGTELAEECVEPRSRRVTGEVFAPVQQSGAGLFLDESAASSRNGVAGAVPSRRGHGGCRGTSHRPAPAYPSR